jgi:hypothetical protein
MAYISNLGTDSWGWVCKTQCDFNDDCLGYSGDGTGDCAIWGPAITSAPDAGWTYVTGAGQDISSARSSSGWSTGGKCMKKAT